MVQIALFGKILSSPLEGLNFANSLQIRQIYSLKVGMFTLSKLLF